MPTKSQSSRGTNEPSVLYEDSDVAILSKPAGIATHPSPAKPDEPTLIDWVVRQWPDVKSVGEDPQRPGIVHRLDKETSGVIAIAKTNRAFEFFKKEFQERRVEKTYIALVIGLMPQQEGKIERTIARSTKFGKFTTKRSSQREGSERPAITYWKVIDAYRAKDGTPLSLLEVKPETGRTHQIRVHLAAIGHPVAGDPLYGGDYTRSYRAMLGRMFLHAHALGTTLPSGKKIFAEAELPQELRAFLEIFPRLERDAAS